MKITHVHTKPYALPLARPWVTPAGCLTERRGLLLTLKTAHGLVGQGEAAPLPGFSPDDFTQASQELERACADLVGEEVGTSLKDLELILERHAVSSPSARYAMELALLDLMAQVTEQPLACLLEPGAAARVAVNATVGADDPEVCARLVREAVAEGFGCVKLKVGRVGLDADIDRVAQARRAAGEKVAIRVDANGAWSVAEASRFLNAVEPYHLEMIEQPVATIQELASLRLLTSVPVAADESARSEEDVARLIEAEAADIIVLKPAFIGGLLPSLSMARQALAQGVGVLVTTVIEGAVGRAGAYHLASALGSDLAGACGLATGHLLEGDVCSRVLEQRRGFMTLPNMPGLGVGEAASSVFDPEVPLPLMQRARFVPDQPAVVAEGGALTYRELLRRADACAARLQRLDVSAGDRVAVLASNSLELVVLLHALTRLGAVHVALHPRWTGEESLEAATRARCAVVVTDTAAASRWPGAAGVKQVALESVAADGDIAPKSALRGHVRLGEPCAVLFSSGMTGAPKGVALSWGNVFFSATGSAIQLGHGRADRWLAVLPLCHVGGLSIVMRCALLGTTVVLREGFEASAVAAAIREGDATLVSLVPTMLRRVLEAGLREGDVPAEFRTVLLGGGPIDDELLKAARGIGLPVSPTYGMTEASSQITTASPGGDGAGFPLVWTEVAVQDDGELWVRGPTVSTGYLGQGGAIVPQEGGWLKTGDQGRWDEAMRLRVLDRRTDRIVSGGENVHPAEVESVIEGFAAVDRACVIGLRDVEWGHRVVAVLVTREPGAKLDEEALASHCRARLAAFKVPRQWIVVRELPRSGLGKLNRRAVRERVEAEVNQARISGGQTWKR